MESEYYVYFEGRGWWGVGGTYTSEIKHAKRFSRDEAIIFTRGRFNSRIDSGPPSFPVAVADIEAVMK